MKNSNILISISTYKESENIIKIIDEIRVHFPFIKILIVDDKSNDNTKNLIEDKNDKNIIFVQRPKKLGLGTHISYL